MVPRRGAWLALRSAAAQPRCDIGPAQLQPVEELHPRHEIEKLQCDFFEFVGLAALREGAVMGVGGADLEAKEAARTRDFSQKY